MKMASSKKLSGKREIDPTDPTYCEKRNKNNEAVKKSREKTRMKAKDTMEKVSELKQENEMLEERIKLLSKELTFLKDIFMAHAGSAHGITVDDMEIKSLLEEDEVGKNLLKN
jgi:CCAAT/enhancer binding protein (C/EBP) gamma